MTFPTNHYPQDLSLPPALQQRGLSHLDLAKVAGPISTWAHNCHATSLALVSSGILGTPGTQVRVVRGQHAWLSSQHSWIVLSGNTYDDSAIYLDPTLWSYVDDEPLVKQIEPEDEARELYILHGSILPRWNAQPQRGTGQSITLTPEQLRRLPLTSQQVLADLGDMDAQMWSMFAKLPVTNSTNRAIVKEMIKHPSLRAFVPIDILGMITDENPSGLYF